jgi:hypothetical protein
VKYPISEYIIGEVCLVDFHVSRSRLHRHCHDGQQHSNNGFLVHIVIVFVVNNPFDLYLAAKLRNFPQILCIRTEKVAKYNEFPP